MKGRKAAVSVARLETRFLPAAKVISMEALTIVDRPAVPFFLIKLAVSQ